MASKQMYITLNTGSKMPAVGLGTRIYPIGEKNRDLAFGVKAFEQAIDAGYRLMDTATLYGTEKIVGEAVNNKIKAGVIKREDIFVTTKLRVDSFGRNEVVPALKWSLSQLQLDYVDLYLMHWPTPTKGNVHIFEKSLDDEAYLNLDHLETWRGMEECYNLGLAKAIGISNFNIEQTTRLLNKCTVKPACTEIESHPFLTNTKLIEFSQKNGMAVTAYCPLTGLPYNDQSDRPSVFTNAVIKDIAERIKKTPAQVALRYQLQRNVAVVPKSTNPERMKQNLQVFDFELSAADMALISSLNQGYRLLNPCKGHPQDPFIDEYLV